MNYPGTTFTHLQCTSCQKTFSKDRLLNLCPDCHLPLFARYDLERARSLFSKDLLAGRESTMWRYGEVMPVEDLENVVTLGEGWTPLVAANRLGKQLGFSRLFLKDESLNPTGSFKARGLAAAISKAKELKVEKVAIPTAGNAGGATAAYGAKAGIEAHIFMPEDTPSAFQVECEQYGARVEKVKGVISDCGRLVGERKDREGWFDVSTLKEPYRVEGKKTMGYELAEQLGWELPEVIIYPTGGGTGIIGMWKAFEEMEALGWIGSARPRMISVQAEGCAPMVRAFDQGWLKARTIENPTTIASGLRVPGAVGDFLILHCLRESHGTALAVTDEALMQGVHDLGRTEGVFAAPEAGATVASLKILKDRGLIDDDERIVLFITGSGTKYSDLFTYSTKPGDSRKQPNTWPCGAL